jgi:hypothetical protein
LSNFDMTLLYPEAKISQSDVIFIGLSPSMLVQTVDRLLSNLRYNV